MRLFDRARAGHGPIPLVVRLWSKVDVVRVETIVEMTLLFPTLDLGS